MLIDLSNLLDPANAAWSLGSNLLAPLFDGGARQESVNIATAEQKAAVAQYVDAALSAFGDVESGLELSESLRLRLESLEEASAQAAEAYRLAATCTAEPTRGIKPRVRRRVLAATAPTGL